MKRQVSIAQATLLIALGALLLTCTEEKTIVNPAPAIDHIAPEIVWVSPEPNAELSGDATLTFTAADSGGIARISLYRNGSSPADWQITPHTDSLYTLAWNTTTVDDGLYILEVRAWDAAGNAGVSPALLVRVKNTPTPPPDDRTPPDVWWESPDGGATLRDTVTLRVRVFDESSVDSVHLLKDGALVVSLPPRLRGGARGGEYEATYLWNTRADSDGVHLLSAVAWDSVGNDGESQVLLVKVQNNATPPTADHTPPVIVWQSPENGATVEGTVELAFDALDDDIVDSVKLYISGQTPGTYMLPGHLEARYAVNWETDSLPDGVYFLEARAWDRNRNVGISDPVTFTVWNHRPRVLWVPDDFETIQGAIFASRDRDTVRVRAGEYREQIYLSDRRIWLESDEGPDVTVINAIDFTSGTGIQIPAEGNQDTTLVIRGFTIHDAQRFGVAFWGKSSGVLVNCIIENSGLSNLHVYYQNFCIIRNNVFAFNGRANIEMHYSNGVFENNLILHSTGWAIWNVAVWENPIRPDHNLIWDYENLTNDPPIRLGEHNLLDIDPLIADEFYHLQENSPCIDAGNPEKRDLDGSISDIGAYGGPLAYPPK